MMLLSARLRIKADMVSTLSLTPRRSTAWLRIMTPSSNSFWLAADEIQDISFGWLKCVCHATALPARLALLEMSMSASTHPSDSSRTRLGATASPLEAKRKRLMFGMLISRSPMSLSCSGCR